MKKLFYSALAIAFLQTGCHSNNNNTMWTDQTIDTATENLNTASGENGIDNIVKVSETGGTAHVFVGSFATWNLPDKSSYDGSYDAEQKLFFVCQSKKFLPVPADEITLINFGTCDDVKKEFMIYDKKPGGDITLVPGVLTLEGNKGIIKQGSTIHTVNFDAALLQRIEEKKRTQMIIKPDVTELKNDSIKMITPHHFQDKENTDTSILMKPKTEMQSPIMMQPLNHKEPEKINRQMMTPSRK